ncbi:hypothetical protein [Halalkalibacter akibai]|uniref:DUF4760 domain-containing protein n=1 Tax=Halalkalibacter akibai (strain ATCC 43226 / DSM 21942 / CIP 109018 / JCM 9157 / 1139) TaxID=1236973 RepID=W4QUT3_HALA3|nr:hypothetical protein [Halalkalibacter akibai]GAE35846.1 hypothetical protein JCM9157_2983 [Halalkalibacter akibai JCM 9157]
MLILDLLLLFFILIVLILVLRNQRTLNKNVDSLRQLQTSLMEPTQYYQHKLLEEKKAHILILAFQIRDAIAKQQYSIHANAIENMPLKHSLSDLELASVFSPSQALLMKKYWALADQYIETYWLTHEGKIKTIFKGRADDPQTELGQMHHASKNISKQLDIWLAELNSNS